MCVSVCGGRVYKNKKGNKKIMNQLGHWNGHWDCGTDKEKLHVALFSTKLFTEESDFFCFIDFFKSFFFSFFPNEGTR